MPKLLKFEHTFAAGPWTCKVTVPDQCPVSLGPFLIGTGPNPEFDIEWFGKPFNRTDRAMIIEEYRDWMFSIYQKLCNRWNTSLIWGLVTHGEPEFEAYEFHPNLPPRRINSDLN